MVYGHLPNLRDNELLASYPDRILLQKAIQEAREAIGKENDRVNKEQQKLETEVEETIKEGDLVLARVLPKGAAKLGDTYRKNIFKVIERKGRKLTILAPVSYTHLTLPTICSV